MQEYRLRCWDDGVAVSDQDGSLFLDEDEAVYAALELACDHETVELWRGDALIAYLARTNEPAMAASRVLH
ncbi:MAG TPA: hypothetical protein VG983_01895 [Caulobacterales bacterium]|jgi:hypothetical protein|nr:hypothetical protein [Caulobacterales bacterium]